MKKVEVKTAGKEVLSRVPRMFDRTEKSLFLEIFQNARRSGANKVWVKEIEGGVVIGNNGAPIDDFQTLLTLGQSGWDENSKNEDPAGMGFFATNMCDSVIISSFNGDSGQSLCIEDTSLMLNEGARFPVIDIDNTQKHFRESAVEIILKGNFMSLENKNAPGSNYYWKDSIEKIMRYVDMTMIVVTENGERTVEYILDSFGTPMYNKIFNGMRYRIYNVYPLELSLTLEAILLYHGHIVSGIMRGISELKNKAMVITPTKDSNIRLVLPARHTIVKDDAYEEMRRNTLKAIGENIIENMNGVHFMPFEEYLKIKSILPDFPEAKSPVPPAKYLVVSSDEQGYSNTAAAHELIQDKSTIYRYIYAHQKGYSWLNDYIVVEDISIIYDNEVIVSTSEDYIIAGVYPATKTKLLVNGTIEEPAGESLFVNPGEPFYDITEVVALTDNLDAKVMNRLVDDAAELFAYVDDGQYAQLEFQVDEFKEGIGRAIADLMEDDSEKLKIKAQAMGLSATKVIGTKYVASLDADHYVFSKNWNTHMPVEKVEFIPGFKEMSLADKKLSLSKIMTDDLINLIASIIMKDEGGNPGGSNHELCT